MLVDDDAFVLVEPNISCLSKYMVKIMTTKEKKIFSVYGYSFSFTTRVDIVEVSQFRNVLFV